MSVQQFHAACAGGRLDQIRQFLDSGVAVDSLREDMTPLHRAIGKDQKEAVELLLQCGANKEAIDKLGLTPLLAALHLGFRGAAEVLLKNGASILAVMPTTLATALHIAVATASFTTAFTRQLITLGHPVDARDKNGETPLMACAKSVNSSDSQLDCLLASGASINARSKKRETALHLACYHARDASAKFLILRGIDVFALSKLEKTAFDVFGSAPFGRSEGKEKVDRLNALKAIHYDILLHAHVAMKRPAQVVEKQLLAQDHADVAFVSSEGERIYAHKFVVTAYSPQFKAMIRAPGQRTKTPRMESPPRCKWCTQRGRFALY